jgi:hypothetical protein
LICRACLIRVERGLDRGVVLFGADFLDQIAEDLVEPLPDPASQGVVCAGGLEVQPYATKPSGRER